MVPAASCTSPCCDQAAQPWQSLDEFWARSCEKIESLVAADCRRLEPCGLQYRWRRSLEPRAIPRHKSAAAISRAFTGLGPSLEVDESRSLPASAGFSLPSRLSARPEPQRFSRQPEGNDQSRRSPLKQLLLVRGCAQPPFLRTSANC